jgi:hypothetical protein
MMKIGIIGAGSVGESLGRALLRAGHEVMFSSRDPESERMQALRQSTGAAVGTTAETLAYSDIIAVALRWDAVPAVVQAGNWQGKIVIDLMNRFGAAGSTGSAAQELAALTGARVVKALNTIGAEHYQNPIFNGEAATMLIAGDDAEAKDITTTLLRDLGFDVVDAGSLAAAVHLERLAELWVHLAMRAGLGRDFGFRIVRR